MPVCRQTPVFEEGTSRTDAIEEELARGLPYLQIEQTNERAFEFFVKSFFAADRYDVPKGMIEVIP